MISEEKEHKKKDRKSAISDVHSLTALRESTQSQSHRREAFRPFLKRRHSLGDSKTQEDSPLFNPQPQAHPGSTSSTRRIHLLRRSHSADFEVHDFLGPKTLGEEESEERTITSQPVDSANLFEPHRRSTSVTSYSVWKISSQKNSSSSISERAIIITVIITVIVTGISCTCINNCHANIFKGSF
eukprot:TRINITY_DN2558_c0_g1_i3.p1 TRINITY_DN2558_c0_g1~~TRINITY_DN2558_c0_g1_i3.p1  ORF type:complete len:185 (+),score=29.91 TRINITY_DN2558_c0_g1_i3:53-607(+)